MKIKKRLLIISIMIFMVFSAGSLMHSTFAFWSNVNLNDQVSDQVPIGEWNQIFQWDPDATYLEGDLVTNNGITYEAKRDNPTREPGVDSGWNRDWTQID